MASKKLTAEERQLWMAVFGAAYVTNGYTHEAAVVAWRAIVRLRTGLRAYSMRSLMALPSDAGPDAVSEMAIDAMRHGT